MDRKKGLKFSAILTQRFSEFFSDIKLRQQNNKFLIAAFIFSAGYYSAPIFIQFKEFGLYWGAVFFYDWKRNIGGVSFLIGNFVGVFSIQEVECVKIMSLGQIAKELV